MIRKSCFPLIFLLLSGFGARPQNYTATNLELFDGREHVFVKDITTDSKGFVWFLSKGKVFRFNGYKSLPIMETLPRKERVNEVFNHILIDGGDRLWIAGIQHLYCFDLKTWKLSKIPGAKLPKGYDLEILDIKKSPEGQVFIRYNNGQVVIIQNGTLQKTVSLYPQKANHNPIPSIWSFEFWRGYAWFGGSDGRLYSVSLDRPYAVETHTFEGLENSIEQIIPQEDRLILVDLWRSKFFQVGFYKPGGKLDIKNIVEYYPEEAIRAMIWDYGAGRGREKSNNRENDVRQKEVFIRSFLASNNIVDINASAVLDRDLILATSDGIWIIHEKTKGISSLVPENPINKSVRGIYQFRDNSIFFCSYGGAEFLEPDGTRHYFPKFNGGYSIIPLDENRILITIQGGIPIIFDKSKIRFEALHYSIPEAIAKQGFSFPNYVLSLAQDGQFIYFGSLNSLWKLNKKTRKTVPLLNPENPSQLSKFRVNHISLRDNGLLLSTSLGLFGFDDGKLGKIYPKDNTLGIYKHLVSRDTIWLATQGAGLVAVGAQGKLLRQYDQANGLSGNMVYSLAHANGYIMAGTGSGLSSIKNGRINRMDVSDGLLHNEFNHKSVFYSEENKKLFMGGLKGYTIFDMARDWSEKKKASGNYITQISIAETKNSRVEKNYSHPYKPQKKLELEPGQNLMVVSIGNPKSYKTNQRLQYKIKGLINAWQPLPVGKQISLMGLSPGKYGLEIRNAEAKESHPLLLNFKKLPAFHQTLWFRLLAFSIPVFLLWIWYRARLDKIRKEQALRAKIASDLHDDVGTILSTISMQAEYLQISKKEFSKKSTLKKIADSSKNAISAMGDIVWSLDARSDNWNSFIVKMREFGHALFEEPPIDFKLTVSGKPPKNLPQEDKQTLYLIYKEALNNIHKHSKASKAEAWLLFSDAKLVLRIKDNGTGLDSGMEKSGQGIKNMEMRAKKIKAKFGLSHAGEGLQITLTKNFRKKSPLWG